jgi:nitroimidazol reductase NimA-like FMN-containing flavoprotein (pyridoxamine 5'-phosphate oxidase superfamily)
MTEEEIWAFLTEGHTGILTTLRQDGHPIALPVWYAVVDRRIYVVTRGKKVARVAKDSRCSFLVESGERWAELQAVHVVCEGHIVELDNALDSAIRAEMSRKYAPYRTAPKAMPDATRQHYASSGPAVIELVPLERILNWDNRKLGL